jgi:putative endonuclease
VFYTYFLKSVKGNKTYVGHTDDWKKRLKEHNLGRSSFTRKFKPWRLIHLEEFKTKKEAIKREKYLKSAAGRKWIERNLF